MKYNMDKDVTQLLDQYNKTDTIISMETRKFIKKDYFTGFFPGKIYYNIDNYGIVKKISNMEMTIYKIINKLENFIMKEISSYTLRYSDYMGDCEYIYNHDGELMSLYTQLLIDRENILQLQLYGFYPNLRYLNYVSTPKILLNDGFLLKSSIDYLSNLVLYQTGFINNKNNKNYRVYNI